MAQVTQGQPKGVRTQHKDYKKMLQKWQRCRDVMEGEDAVKGAGESYLPKLKEQQPDSYAGYVKRATFYNASWRTAEGFKGMIFRKPPKQELSAKVEPYTDNIDLAGNPLDQFAQDVTCDVLEVGRIGLLVDHPPALVGKDGGAPTVAEAEAAGLRPTIKQYAAETIINWKTTNIKNSTVLSMVVLTEQHSEPDPKDEFGDKCETRYRVLDLDASGKYRVRVFRINDKDEDEQVGEPIYPLMDGKPLDYIPFVFIGPDGTGWKVNEPPMIDLINVNLAHYRVSADYEHGCHFTGLPTPVVSGYTPPATAQGMPPEKLYIGSDSAWIFPDANAKATYLEGKKQEMATLGARMLADTTTRQVETFGATAIKHVAENSVLAAIAISVSKGLQIALGWFQNWAGDSAEPVYDLNRDFLPVQMDGPTLTAIMGAWQGGMLSEAEMFDLLKRGDIIEADKTLEDHQGEIDSAPPPAPPSNAQPGRLGLPTHEEAANNAADAAGKLADAVPPTPAKKAA